ncbi:MAG: FprA family A-type flavoprotein [Candidatus Gastranaerophilales bacterium]|nr:FprA family A-type flavoprotein [Candidatus Gastranaerophilales bacterium]
MKMTELAPNIFACGEKDKDRKMFDQLIPLPEGTTYNSYFVKGSEKSALIDTVYPPKVDLLLDKIEEANIEKIDYIISNHAEQDHSGAIPALLERFPDAMVVTNERVKDNVVSMLHVPEDKFIIVKDGDSISLGDKTLEFILAPFVHWPDTMFTYLVEDKYLFTCDLFGAHYTTGDVWADYSDALLNSAKRYYAEIMMPFRSFAAKYCKKIREIDPNVILPSHGPVYDKPEYILDAYDDWTSDRVKNKVIMPYVSMYDSTKIMAEYLTEKLEEKGVEVVLWDLIEGDTGELLIDAVDAATMVIGVSMVLSGPHPSAVYASYLLNALKPKLKYYSIIGSYGWGGNLTKVIENMFTIIKPEKLEYVIIKGRPKGDDFAKLDALANEIAQKHEAFA